MDESSEDEQITVSSHASSGKSEQIKSLHEQLLRESLTRQEASELYQKLQSEYDVLLAKHAEAENTIDQLRIGARIDLFSDGPIPHQAEQLKVIEIKTNPHPIPLPLKERAVLTSPGLPVSTETEYETGQAGNGSPNAEDRRNSMALHRLKDLQNDLIAFQSALADRELSYEEQKNLYNALKDKYDILKEELKKKNQSKGSSQGTMKHERSSANSFMDPSSLEGELYRLELRLAEVCDDIGEQLYSNRENDGALEEALRDDFQRMRLSSFGPETSKGKGLSGNNTAQNTLRDGSKKKGKHFTNSRSNSDLSGPAPKVASSQDRRGSSSNDDKKEALSPSNEDLAESGYYASESMIRESPKRDVTANVPFRYLTRSRSPNGKSTSDVPIRRHWSLSEYNSQSESIDELTLHSSNDGEEHSVDGRKTRPGRQSGLDKSDQLFQNDIAHPVEANPTERSSQGASPQSKNAKESPQSGPVATSSPYEEKNVRDIDLPSHNKDNCNSLTDDVSSFRRRPRKVTRASPSDKSMLENRSDGRKSSLKSGSRLSKTRPRQYNYSSSEESKPTNRPDRLNSSVYSEQDKVPSLINHPKSNAYMSRLRPNTAESNLDSGFVGSEGTMKSQDLSNGVKQVFARSNRRPSTLQREATKEEQIGEESHLNERAPSLDSTRPIHPKEDRRNPLEQDRSIERLSDGKGTFRSRDTADHFDKVRSKISNPSKRLRESSRRKNQADDVISLQTSPETQTDANSFRRLPVTVERHPFVSTVRGHDVEDSPGKETKGGERYSYSARSSLTAYTDPRRSPSHSKVGDGSRLSDSRSRRLPRANSEGRTREDRSYDEDPFGGRLVKSRSRGNHRSPYSANGSFYSSKDGRKSHYADRLHEDLQLLRSQVSQLNRGRLRDNEARELRSASYHSPKSETPKDQSYDDVKNKLSSLNDQLQKSLHRLNHRNHGNQDGGYQPNRDYEELKRKIDYLTQELQKSNEIPSSPRGVLHRSDLMSSQPGAYPKQEEARRVQESVPRFLESREPTAGLAEPRESLRFSVDRPRQTSAVPLRTHSEAQPTQYMTRPSQPTYLAVCPICAGIGYHRHGDYVFYGDSVQVIDVANGSNTFGNHVSSPVHPVKVSTPVNGGEMATSTPNRSMHNTIHHIHTIHTRRKSRVNSSSSESQSDGELERGRRRRNRNRSRPRRNPTNRLLDEYDDWRLNESLNDAVRAASNMQMASKRMLNNLATDLIKSEYSEY